MKKFLITSFMAVTTVFGLSASARSLVPYDSAQLTGIYADPMLGAVKSAAIMVTPNKLILRVSLDNKLCRTCKAIIGNVRVYQLPITKSYSDRCGSRVFIARRDLRMTDGALQVLVVRDNRGRTCQDARPGTEVRYATQFYNRIQGRIVKTNSVFTGPVMHGTLFSIERR